MSGPDALHTALGRVLTSYHYARWCGAWLTIGLAAALVEAQSPRSAPDMERAVREYIARSVGRVASKAPERRRRVLRTGAPARRSTTIKP